MPELTLKELRDKVATRGGDIDKLFAETKIDGASVADGQWDFRKAKSFGLEGKSTADVSTWLDEQNAELAELTDDLNTRIKIQQEGEANEARQKIDPPAPEWASRLLKVREVCGIVDENPSTIYRKVGAGIYPGLIHMGGSSRMPGWDLWGVIKALMAERDEPEAG